MIVLELYLSLATHHQSWFESSLIVCRSTIIYYRYFFCGRKTKKCETVKAGKNFYIIKLKINSGQLEIYCVITKFINEIYGIGKYTLVRLSIQDRRDAVALSYSITLHGLDLKQTTQSTSIDVEFATPRG